MSDNPYDAVVSQFTEEKLRGSMSQAIDRQPESEALVQGLAKRYNLPPEAVRLQKPEIERRAKLDGMDYKAIVENFATTAQFLSDPNNASLAHDDVESMIALEAQFGALTTPKGPKPNIGSTLYGLGKGFGTGLELTRQGIRQQAADVLGFSDMSADAQRKAEQARFRQELVDPAFESSTAQGLYGGARSLVQMAPGVAASIATRSPAPALAVAGVQTEADAYTKYRSRGASPLMAFTGALGEGAVEVGTEMLPMGTIVDKFGKTGATKFLTEFLAKDLVGEEAATLAQDAIDTAIANPDKTWGDYIKERPNAAYQTALGTLIAGGALTAAGHAMYRVSGEKDRADEAQRQAEALQQLNDIAAASKLRQRDPEAFKAFIEKATETGAVQDVYVNPKDLAQSGVDIIELAGVSPSVAEQMQSAIDTGADIKIPLSEYGTSIAGTDLGTALIDHIKTDPNGMTRAQAEEFYQQEGEKFQSEVEKVLEEKKGDQTFKASMDVVRQDVADQLTKANRFTADVNAPYADLMANFYAVQAARAGVTPEEMYKRYPVKIQAENVAGPQLDQADRPEDVFNIPGVDTYVEESASSIHLSRIEVDHDKQNKGLGTTVMRNITAYADQAQKPITLKVTEDLGSSAPRLVDFYERFGFKMQEDGETMARTPRAKKELNQSAQDEAANYGIPGFYSKMQKVLGQKLNATGTPAQFKQQIEALVKNGQFKQDEYMWSGLGEYLDSWNDQNQKLTRDEVLSWLRENKLQIAETQYSYRPVTIKVPLKKNGMTTNGFDRSQYPTAEDVAWSDAEQQEPDQDAINNELDMLVDYFTSDHDPQKWYEGGNDSDLVKVDDEENPTSYEWDSEALNKYYEDEAYRYAAERAGYKMAAEVGGYKYEIYFEPDADYASIRRYDPNGGATWLPDPGGRINEENLKAIVEEDMFDIGIIYTEDQVNELEDQFNEQQLAKAEQEARQALEAPKDSETITPEQAVETLKGGTKGVRVVNEYEDVSFYTEFDIPYFNTLMRQGSFGERKIITFDNKAVPLTVDYNTAKQAIDKGYKTFVYVEQDLTAHAGYTDIPSGEHKISGEIAGWMTKAVDDGKARFVIFPKHAEVEGVDFRYETRWTGELNWQQYQMQGPKGAQHEITIELPNIEDAGVSQHRWKGPARNILMHLRFSERIGKDGEKVLFIDEIQSDWHQQGAEKGYQSAPVNYEFDPEGVVEEELSWTYTNQGKTFRVGKGVESTKEGAATYLRRQVETANKEQRSSEAGKVANAPFAGLNKYTELAMKRIILFATNNGFDRVAWTTGEQQAARWSSLLQREVESIRVQPGADGAVTLAVYRPGGANVSDFLAQNAKNSELTEVGGETHVKMPIAELTSVFGKGLAEKIVEKANEIPPARITELPDDVEIVHGDGGYGAESMWYARKKGSEGDFWRGYKVKDGRLFQSQTFVGGSREMIQKDILDGINFERNRNANLIANQNIKISSKGMTEVYNKVIPNVTNNIIKKFDSKVEVTKLDTDYGKTQSDAPATSATKETDQLSFPITDALRESAKTEGFSLFQRSRGAFNPTTSTITLLQAADLSTFLHEAGHFFLETMNKMALDPNAPQEVKDDMQTTLAWLGVKDIADWNSRDLEQQRQYHEQFARGFEAYLFEGKSPSVEMQGVFQRFRAWLLNVYKSIKNLNVELSDEIRGVFDRMLATTEQIKQAEAARNFEPLFKNAEEAGLAPEEFKAYHDLGVQATQDAITQLEARSLKDMKWLSNAKSKYLRQLQREAEAKRKAVRREVTDEVMNEPVNRARTFLKRGTIDGQDVEGAHRLKIDDVKQIALDSQSVGLPLDWSAIESKFGAYGVLGTDGVHPDVVAEMFGMTSGSELIRQLIDAEDPKTKIDALTDQRMLERYGDLTDPDVIERAAEAAIHNEARSKFVAAEMNALQKATGGRKILADAAKQYAEAMISRLKVRELSPSRYAAAEARAAKNAAQAQKAGQLAEAAVEKRNQLIQNYATRAAVNAAGEVEKALRYFKKFSKDSIRQNIDADYVDQIDELLARFDLSKNVSLKAIDKRKSLTEWVAKQQEVGLEPDIPLDILNEANRKHYKDMTIEEMRGLVDTVKQIEHLGKLKEKLLTAVDERNFKATVSELVGSIELNAGDKTADNRTRPTRMDRAIRLFKGFLAQHRKISSLARELDGFQDGGKMWDVFVRSMNVAGDKETTMREQATVKLAELVKPILTGGKMGGKGQFFPSIGRSVNREERIAMALNTGNMGNFQRLLDGEGFTHEQIAPVLDSLTKEDWDFVQNIWDFFETYRPMIAAKERRIYGKEPEWVEPTPVNTKFGTYRGGYYPIKYDPRLSAAAEQHNDAEAAKQMMRGAYTSATTRRSFTKSRVDEVKGRPLLLTMDGLYGGLNEVIHDLAWHEWLIDANRLLRNKALDGAIRNRYGADVVRQFKDTVRDVAAGEMPTGDALEKVLGNLRAGATVAGLGLNIMNSVVNVSGLTQSIVRIGPKWVALGAGEWARSPVGLVKQVHEKSEFMRTRAKTQQREINEIRSLIQDKSQLRQAVDRILFLPVTVTQIAIDTPTWWGAYQKAIAEGNEETRAVALADQAVIDAQGSGMVKDLAAVQRGGPYKKLFTTFYSFFNTTYNLSVESVKKTDFKDPLDVARLAGDFLMLYSVPALLATLIKAAMTGGDDDMDKLAKTVINDQISYMFGTMVGLREAAGIAQTLAGTGSGLGYNAPASLRIFQEGYKLAKQIDQGDLDRALTRSAINVGGILLHLPSTQVNRTIDGVAALAEGKTKNPLAVVAGAPLKY